MFTINVMYNVLGRMVVGGAVGYCVGYWGDIALKSAREHNVYDKAKAKAKKGFARCAELASKVRSTPRQDEDATPQAETQADLPPFGVKLTCTDCGGRFVGTGDECLSDVCRATRKESTS